MRVKYEPVSGNADELITEKGNRQSSSLSGDTSISSATALTDYEYD